MINQNDNEAASSAGNGETSSPPSGEAARLSIRKASQDDLVEIVEVWFQGQPGGVAADRESIEEFYSTRLKSQDDRFGFWVAEADGPDGGSEHGRILGWQSLLPCRVNPLFHREWAESSTYIRQNIQARGVGRALLTYVTKGARISGLKKIVGYVRTDNAAIQRIIDALNWTKIGSIPGDCDGDPSRFVYVFSVPATGRDVPREPAEEK